MCRQIVVIVACSRKGVDQGLDCDRPRIGLATPAQPHDYGVRGRRNIDNLVLLPPRQVVIRPIGILQSPPVILVVSTRLPPGGIVFEGALTMTSKRAA
jgi:hypothetical protein